MPTGRPRKALSKRIEPLLWFMPVVVLLLAVSLYPTLFVIWMSFQKTRYYDLAGFVGLANYIDVLTSPTFWETTYTSLVYMAGSLVLSLVLGVFAALILNTLGRTGKLLRVVTLFPSTDACQPLSYDSRTIRSPAAWVSTRQCPRPLTAADGAVPRVIAPR